MPSPKIFPQDWFASVDSAALDALIAVAARDAAAAYFRALSATDTSATAAASRAAEKILRAPILSPEWFAVLGVDLTENDREILRLHLDALLPPPPSVNFPRPLKPRAVALAAALGALSGGFFAYKCLGDVLNVGVCVFIGAPLGAALLAFLAVFFVSRRPRLLDRFASSLTGGDSRAAADRVAADWTAVYAAWLRGAATLTLILAAKTAAPSAETGGDRKILADLAQILAKPATAELRLAEMQQTLQTGGFVFAEETPVLIWRAAMCEQYAPLEIIRVGDPFIVEEPPVCRDGEIVAKGKARRKRGEF
ncbi:hypothetical protein FACS1894139_11170 [Planctomycetales bacterium]|nr:hypothetical protein FACS1894107_09880 [Planctomycetales bacterium]GHS98330.1 hypothetical protein FACS1894108_06290 [Planctomycetales bacterium]GHT06099.1 hypothetical protein FACS1894139_11170 [Planctomycetales bacterium]